MGVGKLSVGYLYFGISLARLDGMSKHSTRGMRGAGRGVEFRGESQSVSH